MDEQTAGVMGFGVITVLMVLVYLAALAFGVYLYVRIARKAGYSGWYAALLFVPVANLVVMIMFAFTEWPIEREVKALRAAQGFGPGPGMVGAGGYPQPVGYGSAGHAALPAGGYQAGGYQAAGYGSPYGPGAGAPDPRSGVAPLPSEPVFNRPDEGPRS